MQRLIELNPTLSPSFVSSNSVAFFRFTTYSSADGYAAKVVSYDVDNVLRVDTLNRGYNILQGFAKRDNSTANPGSRGLWDLSFEQLQSLVDAGIGTEYAVPANDSYVD